MNDDLRKFEWLGYISVAIDAVSAVVGRMSTSDRIIELVVAVIGAALVWAAARRLQTWAAWILVVFAVLGLVTVVGEFWAGGPSWLREMSRPDAPPTTMEKMMDLVSELLLIAALYFYFARRSARTSPDVIART